MPFLPRRRWRGVFVVIACAVLGRAECARAETVPPGTVVPLGQRVDAAGFARALTSRYNVELRRVVVADIDRDGDRDVLATTEGGLSVWVNDGSGRLTSQAPPQSAAVLGGAPGNTWRGRRTRDQESIQNTVPAIRLALLGSPAPPVPAPRSSASFDALHPSDGAGSSHGPRAPPAQP